MVAGIDQPPHALYASRMYHMCTMLQCYSTSHHMPYMQVGCTTRVQCYNVQCYKVQCFNVTMLCTSGCVYWPAEHANSSARLKPARPVDLPSSPQSTRTTQLWDIIAPKHWIIRRTPRHQSPMKAKGLKIPDIKSPSECPIVPEMTSARIAKEQRILKWAIYLIQIKLFHIEAYMSVETCSIICPHLL